MSETSISLGEAVIPRTEKATPSDFPNEPYLGLDDIEAHTTRLLGTKESSSMKSAAKRFYERDVLYSRLRPYLNKVWLADRTGLCSAEFIILPSNEFIIGSFLKYRLSAMDFVAFANALNAGDRPRVDFDQISQFQLPTFAPSYQKRIVSKIEELFSELDAGEENLRQARRQLGVYRQSLLKRAFEGKLTATWRTQHPDLLESPDQLLALIQSERQTRYQKQFEEWERTGRSRGKPKKPGPMKSLPNLISPPDSTTGCWLAAPLEYLIDEPAYGTSKKCGYETGSIGVLRIPNIVNGVIDSEDLKYADFSGSERNVYALTPGDLLMIRSNGSVSIVGRCAVVEAKHKDFLYAGYLIRLRPLQGAIDSRFLLTQLSSKMLRSQIEASAKSTSGVNNINSKEIQRLNLAVPSLPEQQEIVRLLDAQFEVIEQNEREIDAALKRSEALRQSILQKAFSGQLVPQDPADEPASALLERIRAERAAPSTGEAPARKGRKAAGNKV